MGDLSDASYRFRNFVGSAPAVAPLLPLVHTVIGKQLNEILRNRMLDVSECDIFVPEKLLYLFYGKPAYRPKDSGLTSISLWRALISFALRPEALPPFKRVFPFDSGACHDRRFEPYVEADFDVTEFSLQTDKNVPQKVVGAFYESNSNYWSGEPTAARSSMIEPLDFHSRIYVQLNTSQLPTEFDGRSGVVEVQCDVKIPLNANTLEAIIVPDPLRCEPSIVDLAKECNAAVLGYCFTKDRPSERGRLVEQAVGDWLRTIGRL